MRQNAATGAGSNTAALRAVAAMEDNMLAFGERPKLEGIGRYVEK